MIRTSREGAAARPRSSRRWAVAAIAVVVCLAALSSALAAGALERGPRIRGVDGDIALAVEQAGVTLVFRADQPLDPSSAEGVRVDPAAPFQVEVAGSTIRLRFTDTVDHARDYRVSIPALRGRATGVTADAAFDFTTPPLTLTTLERGGGFDRSGGDDDRIVRHDLSSDTDEVLFSAPRIQEYSDDGAGVVAAVLDQDGRASLTRAGPGTDPVPLPLPGQGTVGLLRASGDAGRAGFVFTGTGDDQQQYTSTLFLIDPADPGAGARAAVDIGGQPLQADLWFFIPGSAYLVAQTPVGSLVLVDATGSAPPRPLGEVGALRGVLPASTSLVVQGATGPAILDLTNGSLADIVGAATEDASTGSVFLSDSSSVRWTATDVVRRTSADGGTEILRSGAGERIEEVCVSPSGRYAAVGLVSSDAQIDQYPTRAEWLGRDSAVVDLTTGDVLADVPGTRPNWCA
ncbi:hypothetical protein [Microbacterium trichothecenolyticum]|uniref:SbsA Ig-like domain-containing protein n=1 Tax=Microbacterium trichothecenolyticum TaxID=69370 RepID=A0ABU0TV59_MICTR|nr:hypothetical protein [Microbacterium trichothecenolyticum]MDQ1123553.1 hypothetical protein [Microbacterium trichothecenolyticum]